MCGPAAERAGPGVVGFVANTAVVHSLAGIKAIAGLASWASLSAVRRFRPTLSYPLVVRRADGTNVTLDVVRPGSSNMGAPDGSSICLRVFARVQASSEQG